MTFVSYAQNFEDVRLWRAFSDISEGRYLDIGTQDPVRDSVSLAFYERGWRGVHVEPTPNYAAAMRLARPDETVIEAAVSDAPGPIQFFEIPETGLSTGVGEIADRHANTGWDYRTITVPTVTLAGLFDLMGDAPIHWLKIDVEGMEADVIKSWGDHPARPIALVIEATEPSTQNLSHQAWHDLVLSRGYRDVLFDGLSRYFIHETHAERGAALALSPNVFDGFNVEATHFVARKLVRDGVSAVEAAQRDAQIERQEALAAASAQAQAEHLAEIGILRQQAEAERIEALAAASAQAQAEHLAEIATLKQQAEAERIEALAAASAQAQAEHLAQIASLKQQAEAERTEALAAVKTEAAAVLDVVRAELDARILAGEKVIAEMRHALATQHQQGQTLAREAGWLEGQLTARVEAGAAARSDAEAVRRDLAARLSRTEKALDSARTNEAHLRETVQTLVSQHALSLMQVNASLEAAEARATELAEQFAAVSQNLAGSEKGREQAEQQRDQALQQAASQVAAHEGELERLHAHIDWREGQLTQAEQQLDEALQLVASQAAAHEAELERLHAHIDWREGQLTQAVRLFEQAPNPLAGWPQRVAAVLARIASSEPEIIVANHAAQLRAWRADAMLPALVAQHFAEFSEVCNSPGSDAGPVWEDSDMSGAEESVTSLPRLLALCDAEFITTAYAAVLGRAPDPEGGAYYLSRLRAGAHKLEILKQLRRSPEGQEFIPGVAGLDRAIKGHRWATRPLIGPIIRLLKGVEGNSATHRRLRILSNDIGRVLAEHVRLGAQQAQLQVEHAEARAEMERLRSEQTGLAVIMHELASRPAVITQEASAHPEPPIEELQKPAIPPPPLDTGPMPVDFDSAERRLLGRICMLVQDQVVAA